MGRIGGFNSFGNKEDDYRYEECQKIAIGNTARAAPCHNSSASPGIDVAEAIRAYERKIAQTYAEKDIEEFKRKIQNFYVSANDSPMAPKQPKSPVSAEDINRDIMAKKELGRWLVERVKISKENKTNSISSMVK